MDAEPSQSLKAEWRMEPLSPPDCSLLIFTKFEIGDWEGCHEGGLQQDEGIGRNRPLILNPAHLTSYIFVVVVV